MAQTPIQSLAGRAESQYAAPPAALAGQANPALARARHASENGGISGGLLRPGAVDPDLFKAHLEAAQKASGLVPRKPADAPPGVPSAPRSFAGIPNLTPAQLAALGAVDLGAVDPSAAEAPAGGEKVIDIPAPKPADSTAANAGGESSADLVTRFPFLKRGMAGSTSAAPTAPLPTAPTTPLRAESPVEATSAASETMETATAADAVAGDAASAPEAPAVPAPSSDAPPVAQASVQPGPIPGSRRGADGVWELKRLPDKEEREMLRGQQWRVVESEQSRRLFFGPDGKFGWDDFVDVINPLQHIPLVNLAYRAITGDEIYGAARLVDAAFGPLAGVSTVVDLAMRDVTGGGIADNAIAALFGPTDKAGEAPNADGTISTASADRSQLAQAELFRRGSNK